jgi:hypothetical protein
MRTLLILFLLPLQTLAQDITGIWIGFLQIGDNKLPYELAISGTGKKLGGYSLLVFTFNGIENMGIKTMELKMRRGNIAIEDGELIYDNYTTPSRKVKLYGSLVWVGKDSNMTLTGTISTRSVDMRAPNDNSFKGTVLLQRKNPLAQTRLISKLNEMDLLGTLSFIQPVKTREEVFTKPQQTGALTKPTSIVPRKIEIIRSVSFHTDSLVMSLYDNGEVDGDTVSIILNGKIIAANQGLTAKAITKTIYASDLGDSSQLVMYAENLGRFPPNTGLLILQDGTERYQIRFSGDLEKNSAIILRRAH